LLPRWPPHPSHEADGLADGLRRLELVSVGKGLKNRQIDACEELFGRKSRRLPPQKRHEHKSPTDGQTEEDDVLFETNRGPRP